MMAVSMTASDPMARRAVVLLSGGLDSATALAVARSAGYRCHALSIDYGQRHAAELHAAERVAQRIGVEEHRVVHLDFSQFGGSALTDARIAIPETASEGIPVTYVPARNTVMLSLALAWAEILAAEAIFIGVNAIDYSGYPDCRPEYISAYQTLANLATKRAVEGHGIVIRAPLQHLGKSEIIRLGMSMGVDYGDTVSCYQADADGRACGVCDACRFRAAGFIEAGVDDPTRYVRSG
jgi:7-cyano-7-deazaguanine synthase